MTKVSEKGAQQIQGAICSEKSPVKYELYRSGR